LARLRAEGCDEVQGYLFSRPVPLLDVPGLLLRWRSVGSGARTLPPPHHIKQVCGAG
jgi:EAL domain-containing protein (putative c-di-GMP-specific phosphodiesterase class I)